MQITSAEVIQVIIVATAIFLAAPLFLLFYLKQYNKRKERHLEEKQLMNQKFEAELLKTHIEVQEQTMQTIAADLHDNIGQLLSLTTLTLSSIEIKEDERAQKKISNSLVLVNKSIKELRELAKLMNGEQLISSGLGNAIQQEIDWLNRAGVYELTIDNQLIGLPVSAPKKDLIILRLLQEIVNNIIKHAQASQIQIGGELINGVLYLQVKENGIGFDYEQVKSEKRGMGLSSIHKRIEMINGNINIRSGTNIGTSISITIPYP